MTFLASLPRKVVGAGALITDEGGRFLVVEPTYKDTWEIPGGVVEAGESPLTAVSRELLEELGLSLPVGRLLVIDWTPPLVDGLMLVFDGGVLSADQAARIVLPVEELRSWRWCTSAEASSVLSPELFRRMSAAVEARSLGGTAYLEDGASYVDSQDLGASPQTPTAWGAGKA
ncbi:NUDIX hydrolase [Actinoplanes sp. Pm04-4]|uniref:NUDIX hydrolase n=1 Tax=Paractinoplanes pyxinae TaxID=2997416 RepID=A0ABT4B8A8_9ACTN|nr:NUDIX hydrolase [Actinoplanes pyxinae]MCY1142743.1 NUDIX hydrolase [Actinoplanes pyxinae]